jgi:hypothetical protein
MGSNSLYIVLKTKKEGSHEKDNLCRFNSFDSIFV